MDLPIGSKQISHIEYKKLYYLTDTLDNTNILDSSNFDMNTGKPLTNLVTNTVVDNFFLNIVTNSLKEDVNITDKFIFDYPKVLELDEFRDLQVTGETAIDAVFISEGASMKNMFGYYFYTVGSNGEKCLLDNDDNNTDSLLGYYRPTIIFPHVLSVPGNNNTLQLGNTRKLRGNNVNGTFENINVGFFLLPHGWYAKTGSDLYGDNTTLYSTIDFCNKYKDTDYKIVNDKIYSVYAKAKSEDGNELLLVAFEDIFYNMVYNMDYNDCVVGFNISDVTNISNYDNFMSIYVSSSQSKNNIVFINEEGEYVQFINSIYNIKPDVDYVFIRHMIFDSTSYRDAFYDIIKQLLTNYSFGIEKSGDYKIVCRYLFRKNDIRNSQKNNKKELYLIQIKFNNHLKDIADQYQIFVGNNIKNPNYSEIYELYEVNSLERVIVLTDIIDKPVITTGDFRMLGSGIMDCNKGKTHLPFKNVQIYNIYKNINPTNNNGLVINVKMDNHPDGYMFGTKTFMTWVSFNVNSELVIINLDTLDLYNSSMIVDNSQTFNNIVISDVQVNSEYIKNLVSVFRNDSGATYRTVTINGYLTFYCIRFPNIKNNPTMIYLDSSLNINWSNKYNTLSGTFFNKKLYYPITDFTYY